MLEVGKANQIIIIILITVIISMSGISNSINTCNTTFRIQRGFEKNTDKGSHK